MAGTLGHRIAVDSNNAGGGLIAALESPGQWATVFDLAFGIRKLHSTEIERLWYDTQDSELLLIPSITAG